MRVIRKSFRLLAACFLLLAFAAIAAAEFFRVVRSADCLQYVEVECPDLPEEVCRSLDLHVKTVWGSDAAMIRGDDGVWRLSKVRDSGRRAVAVIEVSGPKESLAGAQVAAWCIFARYGDGKEQLRLRCEAAAERLTLGVTDQTIGSLLIPKHRRTINWVGDGQIIMHSLRFAFGKFLKYTFLSAVGLFVWHLAGPSQRQCELSTNASGRYDAAGIKKGGAVL